MALSSLRYRPSADALARSETKSGSYIYDGTVNTFSRVGISHRDAHEHWLGRGSRDGCTTATRDHRSCQQ
eukprot:8109733-Pyramimonas_sp.AAC.1